MRGELLFIILFLTLLSFIFFIPLASSDKYQNSTITVSVGVSEPVAMIEVSPSSINLGDVTKGYSTNYQNITFINRGDLDVNITAVLDNNADKIFKYLEFNTASCSPTSTVWYNITRWGGLKIDRPDDYRGANSDNACIRLNLEKYNENIPANKTLTTQLTLWVMPV